MYNQNNNLWPSMTPLLPYNYGNQPLNPIQLNSNFLPQNANQMSYYNQNQGFGQQFNGSYNYLGSGLVPQTNHLLGSQYLPQTYGANTLTHNYGSVQQNPIQPVITNQNTVYSSNPIQLKESDDNKWLDLLNASQRQVLDQLNKEQEAFELQFKNWEKDFETWKQVNRSHPDSNAYQLYVNQWQEWRQRLVERQQQMKDLRTRTLQQLYSQIKPQISKISKPPPPPPPRSEQPPPLPPQQNKDSALQPPPPPKGSPISLTPNVSNETNDTKSDNEIEIIEIDCNSKTTEENKSESSSETNADPNAVSKAAEAILFIQKQQELLKTLENLKSVKTYEKTTDSSSDDLQVIEPKTFDIKDIVTKMKAIRPPEHRIEANKLLSSLPSLQGIVFQPKPQIDSNNQSIDRSSERQNFIQNNMSVNNNSSVTSQPSQSTFPSNSMFRPRLPTDVINTRSSIPQNPMNRHNFMQISENRWNGPNSSRDSYFRPNETSFSQQTNTFCKYSAQTIDYNHRHENKEQSLGTGGYETPVDNQQYLPSKGTSSSSNNDFYNEMNANNSLNRQVFRDMRQPMVDNTLPQGIVPIEETLTYRDKRYFTQPKSRIVPIDDLLKPPMRDFRPENIVIILRGLPGSGKTFIAKLIKEKEMEFSRSAPRILSIDDYFMTEVERQTKSSESGKTVTAKEYVYEFEKEMESCYRASLLKTYKKTVDDRLFSFIIIDAVNELIGDIEDFYSYAIKNDFTVYVIEMVSNDPLVCHKNNIHNRTIDDIKHIHNKWQSLPDFMLRLDIRSILQNVEMEDKNSPQESEETLKRKYESNEPNVSTKQIKSSTDSEDQTSNSEVRMSRWERMEASESKLDKLDSFKMKTKPTIEEYLQVTDDYDLRLKDKQKRVRWADIEQKKKQEQMRQRGFVVGLDWHQYMDPLHPQRVLTETKYF